MHPEHLERYPAEEWGKQRDQILHHRADAEVSISEYLKMRTTRRGVGFKCFLINEEPKRIEESKCKGDRKNKGERHVFHIHSP